MWARTAQRLLLPPVPGRVNPRRRAAAAVVLGVPSQGSLDSRLAWGGWGQDGWEEDAGRGGEGGGGG
eukprot:3904222-Pyramimonas_sp.AAC.1